jgi:hypothetical protein
MRILGLRRVVILTSWIAIVANPLPIPAFAGRDQDLQTKTPIPQQIEAQPTSASSLVMQPASVAFPIPSNVASRALEQAGEAPVANDSVNDDTRAETARAARTSGWYLSEYRISWPDTFDRCARYGPDLPPHKGAVVHFSFAQESQH